MNNYINYYYNIYPDNIYEQNKIFYFTLGNEKYYFVMFNRPTNDARYLYQLSLEMQNGGSLVHEIIPNKDKDVLTLVNDEPYVLMKVFINEHKKISLPEVIFISMSNLGIKNQKDLDRTDWATLWGAKIDYFEYQISQIGKKYPIVCEYLGYYIGLAENAISYVVNTIKENEKSEYDMLTVAHKRIKTSDTDYDLYNPISFIIDYQVRDLAEYIKARFFEGSDVWPEIEEYFKKYNLSLYSKRLLYARLLFPSYFFDVYEDIVEEKLKENAIVDIVTKANQYENFLIEFHTFINRGNLIPQLDWLNKKNS